MKAEFQLLHSVIYLAMPFPYQPALELSNADNERGGVVLIILMCEHGLDLLQAGFYCCSSDRTRMPNILNGIQVSGKLSGSHGLGCDLWHSCE